MYSLLSSLHSGFCPPPFHQYNTNQFTQWPSHWHIKWPILRPYYIWPISNIYYLWSLSLLLATSCFFPWFIQFFFLQSFISFLWQVLFIIDYLLSGCPVPSTLVLLFFFNYSYSLDDHIKSDGLNSTADNNKIYVFSYYLFHNPRPMFHTVYSTSLCRCPR